MPQSGENVKLVRALVTAAVALGAAVVIQMTTSSPATAHQPHTDLCGNCWDVGAR
jgi:hypothetical protein